MNGPDDGCRPLGTIAIIGGGASGTLLAAHLLEQARHAVDVVVVERSGCLAAGDAYSIDDEQCLLNSPSGEMSAWSKRPRDLARFAASRGCSDDPQAFLPRSLYRKYLLSTLRWAERSASAHSGLSVIAEEAVAIVPREAGAHRSLLVGLRHGGHLEAGHIVLALGAPPAVAPWRRPGFGPLAPSSRLIEDPWARGALDCVGLDDDVLFVGTGLTMVDVALRLDGKGHRGRLFGRSRHGLLPLEQRDSPAAPFPHGVVDHAETAAEVVAAVRLAADKARVSGSDWRSVIAEVRRSIPGLWQRLPEAERARLLRHAQRYWEIHRHRMPPAGAAAISRLRATGRLSVALGRLESLHPTDSGYVAGFCHAGGREMLTAEVVVNCTGPSSDAVQGSAPMRDLVRSKVAFEASGNLELDSRGDVVTADTRCAGRIHTVGWPRRNLLYESTAIPEIRAQVEELVARLCPDRESQGELVSAGWI